MRISFFNDKSTIYQRYRIDNHNILWYIKIAQLFVHCPNGVSEHGSDRTRC